MKKLMATVLITLASSMAYAGGSISADLFPYENYHSSFSITIDSAKLQRFSIQVAYSSGTISDVPFGTSAISTGNDTISSDGHLLATALPVLLSTAGAAAPVPLITGTTYYAIKVSDSLIALATTYAQAVAKDKINIETAPAGAWTLRPLAPLVGTAGFSWSGSNDGTNYVTMGSSQSFVGLTDTVSTRLFDWGEFAYKYLRFTFNGPAFGVFKIRASINGKEN